MYVLVDFFSIRSKWFLHNYVLMTKIALAHFYIVYANRYTIEKNYNNILYL